MSAQHQLNPSDYSEDQLKTLAFAIVGVLNKYGVWQEAPLDREAAAKFTHYSVDTIDRLRKQGKIKAHYLSPGIPLYYPSELNKAIKGS